MKDLKQFIIEANLSADEDAAKFKEGDILDGSWQYTAKIPYFYKVLKNNGKTVTVIELEKKTVSDDGYGQNGTCVPVEDKTKGKELKGRINKWGKLKIKDCVCSIWNGKPVDFWTD